MTTRTRNLSVPRANVTLADGTTHDRVRFTITAAGWRALDRKGVEVAAGPAGDVVNVEPVAFMQTGITWRVDLADGTHLIVARAAGCGCGGR